MRDGDVSFPVPSSVAMPPYLQLRSKCWLLNKEHKHQYLTMLAPIFARGLYAPYQQPHQEQDQPSFSAQFRITLVPMHCCSIHGVEIHALCWMKKEAQ